MIISVTGATGNMGQATVEQLLEIAEINRLKLLVLPKDKRIKKLLKKHRQFKDKLEIIYGNLADAKICERLVKDADYVINMAAVIPPHSDQEPKKAIECNEIGVNSLVGAIEKIKTKQPKLIHISTVALYGNRNMLHPFGRVGDPLLISPFDIYSVTKMRGEFRVLESDIEKYVVLRQTAMLHPNMLSDNMSDGLMFHTCFNAPLEWVTAHDSGVLIANIIRKDMTENLDGKFWKRCFNIGGGIKNCITGFETLDDGFKLIGGGIKDFFEPSFNATRNFHGIWFYDTNKLEDMFHYQTTSVADFWNDFKKTHSYIKLGKIVPKGLIKKFAIERLFKNSNSPRYWAKHNDLARLFAYFGGKEKYESLPKEWKNFTLAAEDKNISNLKVKANAKLVDFGVDIESEKFTLEDLQNYAKMHGGKLISKKFDSIFDKLVWQNIDGENFEARVYSVVKAGHWLNRSYKEYAWDFDRLSKNDKIYAQIWYDSHDKNENKFYSFDKDFVAKMENL